MKTFTYLMSLYGWEISPLQCLPSAPYRTTKCSYISIFQQEYEPVVSCSVLSTKGLTLQILPAAKCVHHSSLPLNIVLYALKLKAVVTKQQTFENFSYSKWQFRGSVHISDCILCGLCSCIETFAELTVKDAKPTSSLIFSYYQTLMDAVTSYWFNWFNSSGGFLPTQAEGVWE